MAQTTHVNKTYFGGFYTVSGSGVEDFSFSHFFPIVDISCLFFFCHLRTIIILYSSNETALEIFSNHRDCDDICQDKEKYISDKEIYSYKKTIHNKEIYFLYK